MRPDRPADLVLRGARVLSMDAARREHAAVAVRDGRIVAVGTDGDVTAHLGPRTRVIEGRGRTILPAFGDAHIHPVSSGLEMLRCELSSVRGLEATLARVAAYADTHPDEPWILGGGWHMADYPRGIPHRADLDRVVPDRPVMLDSRDGHTVWVNTKALELAGIDASTPDPRDGRIEHDPDGGPNGTLQEDADLLIRPHVPPYTADDLVAGLDASQAHLHALGITHWQDASVDPEDGDVAYPAFADRGRLTARVVGSLVWDLRRGLDQIPELVERRTTTARPGYAPTSVKFFADGILENFTGSMLDPYLGADGRPTTNHGDRLIEPDLFGAAAAELDRLGFQVHVHAVGDRAIRDTLDAVAVARRANGPSDTRPHIAHIQVIHPDDVDRFRALDVVANAQADWAALEDQLEHLTLPFLGPERVPWVYPFGSLLRAGARLAMGSDWSVSTANPLEQIEVAVERVHGDHRGQKPAFLPDERIDLMDALAGFTTGSAWVNHVEADVGSIEVGKAADLVVLDRDLLDRSAGAIGEARVVATFVAGSAVYEDAALDG